MRRGSIRAAEEEQAIDLTPMLDVVFIMLIFFIVTATFIKETGIEVNRPDSQQASSQDSVSILVAIDGNNQINMDKRRIDIRAVRNNIERLRAENPEGSLVIQADIEANADTIVQVMDAAREAGVADISLATDQ